MNIQIALLREGRNAGLFSLTKNRKRISGQTIKSRMANSDDQAKGVGMSKMTMHAAYSQ